MISDEKGTFGLIGSASIASGQIDAVKNAELYQTSLMSALVDGVYEGQTTYGELHQHGNFGLGTFNDLDGEMVGFDGIFYQLRSDGSARPVSDDQKTPFAVVTFFKADSRISLSHVSKNTAIDQLTAVTQDNLFTAIRIDGRFSRITVRTVREQKRPFPPLQDAAKGQAETILTNVAGTFAGFRTPAYAGTLGVPGFHLHFITEDRKTGGHVLDFEIEAAEAQLCPMHGLYVELPRSENFLNAKLSSPDMAQRIAAAEGS
ncbi:acetolactate decarboxylase [Methylobacterium sp. WL64]|uniref:acetolactate decarboxylase n=1 Tax=Methylobacterium sp. WL64 TaxID=2603894 RepID=UPI0011C78AE7|nr:acetolactate decarboxylase [Methylobacterium sp. WL64]TXM99563.1 acetolactate decarboxylase [Methylobacterium sp. WL64]